MANDRKTTIARATETREDQTKALRWSLNTSGERGNIHCTLTRWKQDGGEGGFESCRLFQDTYTLANLTVGRVTQKQVDEVHEKYVRLARQAAASIGMIPGIDKAGADCFYWHGEPMSSDEPDRIRAVLVLAGVVRVWPIPFDLPPRETWGNPPLALAQQQG